MTTQKYQYSLKTLRPELPYNYHHEHRLPSAPNFTFSRLTLTPPNQFICNDHELNLNLKLGKKSFVFAP